jgi:hypothetical protein
MARAVSRSPLRAARTSAVDSCGKALVNPDTQPRAPSSRHSSATSSRPANRMNRSPNAFRTSVMRRGSGALSLTATMFGISASRSRSASSIEAR